MKKKALLSLFAALIMLAPALLPMAAAALPSVDSELIAVQPDCNEGVELEYDPGEFAIRCSEQYGVLTVAENRTLTLTARFAEGWTYCPEYTVFFRSHPERVTETANPDGSVTFVFSAVRGDVLTRDELDSIGVYASAAQLPRLDITTSIPFSQIGKKEWVDADFTLTLGTKRYSSGDYEGTGAVKGRGNTSWGQPKKPYSIKLSSKASLLDIPKTKKYAIVPSWSDSTILRNYMTYKACLGFDGIGYVPKCEFVEAYFNGVYNGIYLLVERVDIEENKIDIEEATAEELTGGYLIEKDIDGKIDYAEDQWFNCPYWANQSRDYFVLKTPEPDDPALVSQMLSYLESYMQSVHRSILGLSSEPYDKYVDEPSWADFMIIQELAKNIDGNLKTSCYMVKKAGDDKLYLTAPWDFDLAYGSPSCTWNNADHTHNDYYDCPDAQSPAEFMAINSSCPWFDHLYDDHAEFRELLKSRYASCRRTVVPHMFRLLNSGAAYLASAMPRDEAKWNHDFEEGFSQLYNWLGSRVEWLDGEWLGAETIDLDYALNAAGGALGFSSDGDHPFRGVVKDGRVAAASGNSGVNSSESTVTLTVSMRAGESISFDYKVSTERDYDKLLFEVDSYTMLTADGEQDWQTFTYTVGESGVHTFTWKYRKDYSVASGSDCVWVDNVSCSGGAALMPGDADGSGAVDSADALLVLRYSMGLIDHIPVFANADVNGDGVLDSSDALMILRMALGMG